MNTILVWDIPNRIFHWAFAGSLTAAMTLGLLVDDEQPLFQWHMLFGIVAVFLLIVRLIWGVVGSRYSRFSSYPLHPRDVIEYLISAVASKTKPYAGNNPGSAVAAVLMFVLVVALFTSGTALGGEAIAELHEPLAWALLAIVVLHLAGLAWHTIRHRENIAVAMISGRKTGRPEDAIPSAHPLCGVAIFILSTVWIVALFAGHKTNAATIRLPVIGATLQFGESESHGGERQRPHDDDD